MPNQAIPQSGPKPVEEVRVNYLVTSRRYEGAEYGEIVSLVPTGAVLALVEGGHLKPAQERPTVAAKSKEQ